MLIAPNCSCGGSPELMVVRGAHVFRMGLAEDDKLIVLKGDVVFVNCDQCGIELEFKEVKAAGKS